MSCRASEIQGLVAAARRAGFGRRKGAVFRIDPDRRGYRTEYDSGGSLLEFGIRNCFRWAGSARLRLRSADSVHIGAPSSFAFASQARM